MPAQPHWQELWIEARGTQKAPGTVAEESERSVPPTQPSFFQAGCARGAHAVQLQIRLNECGICDKRAVRTHFTCIKREHSKAQL